MPSNVMSRHNSRSVVIAAAQMCAQIAPTPPFRRAVDMVILSRATVLVYLLFSHLSSVYSLSLSLSLHNASWPWRILLSRAAINQPVTEEQTGGAALLQFIFKTSLSSAQSGLQEVRHWVKVLICHKWTT